MTAINRGDSNSIVNQKAFLAKYAKEKGFRNIEYLVGDEAAEIVKRIFALCMDGHDPTQIARMLKEEQVLTPTVYQDRK